MKESVTITMPPNSGVAQIHAERMRQIHSEGWTPEHDNEHKYGELAAAGAWYADAAVAVARGGLHCEDIEEIKFNTMEFWPWDEEWCKPSTDPISNLIKAGALIAAEIDRLERLRVVKG